MLADLEPGEVSVVSNLKLSEILKVEQTMDDCVEGQYKSCFHCCLDIGFWPITLGGKEQVKAWPSGPVWAFTTHLSALGDIQRIVRSCKAT